MVGSPVAEVVVVQEEEMRRRGPEGKLRRERCWKRNKLNM